MNPFRPAVEISSAEERKLAEVQRAFVGKIQALPENRRNAVINFTAHDGTVDPLTSALARQMKSVIDVKSRIEAAKAEIVQIEATDLGGYRPADPNFKGRMLARKAELEEQVQIEAARALSLRSDDLRRAREQTVLHFRDAAEKAAKAQAILDAAGRLRADAASREVAQRARDLVNGERLVAGEKPLADAED